MCDDVVRGQRKMLSPSIHPVCCTFFPYEVNGTILTSTPLRHTTLPPPPPQLPRSRPPRFDPLTSVVVFPSAESTTVCELGAERVKALKTLVFVESTWEDAGSVLRDPALRGLKHVRLDLDTLDRDLDLDTVERDDVTIPSDPSLHSVHSVHSVHSDLPPSDLSAPLAERKPKKAKKVGLYWRKTPVAVPDSSGSSGGGKRSKGERQ